jgi:hypothetical protein
VVFLPGVREIGNCQAKQAVRESRCPLWTLRRPSIRHEAARPLHFNSVVRRRSLPRHLLEATLSREAGACREGPSRRRAPGGYQDPEFKGPAQRGAASDRGWGIHHSLSSGLRHPAQVPGLWARAPSQDAATLPAGCGRLQERRRHLRRRLTKACLRALNAGASRGRARRRRWIRTYAAWPGCASPGAA